PAQRKPGKRRVRVTAVRGTEPPFALRKSPGQPRKRSQHDLLKNPLTDPVRSPVDADAERMLPAISHNIPCPLVSLPGLSRQSLPHPRQPTWSVEAPVEPGHGDTNQQLCR